MSLARALITAALRSIRVLAPGDAAHVDDLNVGLAMLSGLLLELHDGRGPLTEVDITVNTVASENQRLRIQAGANVTITLPNAVPQYVTYDPFDYGFSPPTTVAPLGTTASADGVQFRQPRDGARIEIVGVTQALYVYRADINMWIAASGLTLAAESPLNARYDHAVIAVLGESLATVFPDAQLSPLMLTRIARGRLALHSQTGAARDPVMADYL